MATMTDMDWTDRLNPLEYADNPGELEIQRELHRLGIENDPCPEVCPDCGGELKKGSGMAGETVMYCPEHGLCWENSEQAIRNVY